MWDPNSLIRIKSSGPTEDSIEKSDFLSVFGHLMRRVDSLKKTLMLGNIEARRRREQQRMRWLDGITNSRDMNLSKL